EALVRRRYLEAIHPGGTPDDDYRLVYALLERLPEPSALRALFLNNAGSIAAARGDIPTARGYFVQALELQESMPEPSLLQPADTRFNVAINAADAATQRATLEEVAAEYEHLLGPGHHRTLLMRRLLARAERDPKAALSLYDDLCADYERHH